MTLAPFEQIEQAFENVRSLQEHLDGEVLADLVNERVDSDHDGSEVAEFKLNRQVEELLLVFIVEEHERKLALFLQSLLFVQDLHVCRVQRVRRD